MKRTSIKDVAAKAQVSITTVSRALNGYSDVSEATREKILKIAEELNYAPDVNARALGGMSEPTIGLIVSDLQYSDYSNMASGVISGVYHACVENNCEFILLATDVVQQEKHNFLQLCRKKNVDGIVAMGLRTDDVYYKEVLKGDIPCALIDINKIGKNLCNISVNNIKASRDAVQYLLELGHENIGMINGEKVADVSKERYSGYATALLDAGKLLNPAYVVHSDFKEERAHEDVKKLLTDNPELTAIFCASDMMAIGAIQGIEELGLKVPEDISVVGFDDIPVARYVGGGITTVKQNPYVMGKLAGTAAYQMFMKEKVPFNIYAPYEFVVRKTAASPRKD